MGNAKPLEVLSEGGLVSGLTIEVRDEDAPQTLTVDGVFIFSGKKRPGTEFLQGVVELDEKGFATVDECCETTLEGVYAIGDVRRTRFHQVATAVGDGAVAGMDAIRHLKEKPA